MLKIDRGDKIDMYKVKIGIIGIGNVGCHVLYTLALMGIGDEFVLIDTNEKKANAERQDVFDSAEFLPHDISVKVGDYPDLKDCDVIVYSVGRIELLIGNSDRVVELKYNIPAARECADRIAASGFNGCIVSISNPCDVVTNELIKRIPLAKGRIFGTGTGLDTARLKAYVAKQCNVAAASVTGYMIGEHGSSQITPWSVFNINGMPLDELAKNDERFVFDRDKAENAGREGGWITFNGKHHTDFAIALTAARCVKAIVFDEKRVMPVSIRLNGEYGESGVCAGVPAIVGAGGVEKVIELPLNEDEKARFHQCCDHIRENIALAAEI